MMLPSAAVAFCPRAALLRATARSAKRRIVAPIRLAGATRPRPCRRALSSLPDATTGAAGDRVTSVVDGVDLSPLAQPPPLSTSRAEAAAAVDAFFNSPGSDPSLPDDLSSIIKSSASSLSEFLVSTRRFLHRHPELMYQERVTSAAVRRLLGDMGVEHTSGWAVNTKTVQIPGPGGYGVVADVGFSGDDARTGADDGKEIDPPCVILRADMDALPIHEETDYSGCQDGENYRSLRDGRMHACGHDSHTTMLLGAASVLKSLEPSLPGAVRLVFQPAEEGGAGMKRMIEEGLLELRPRASCAFGMHVWPTLPSGTVASRAGPLLAACERFEVVLEGRGGHAAMPHLTRDPIVAMSSAVVALQTLVSRELNPLESGVVSVTKIDAGDAFNVIPERATIKGTVRALSEDTLLRLRDRAEDILRATAEMHGCSMSIKYSPDHYPPTVNDPDLLELASTLAAPAAVDGTMRVVEPTMAAEDFSFLTQNIPSAFLLLGSGCGGSEGSGGPRTDYGLHHPQFALDENVMTRGVELHVRLALGALKRALWERDREEVGTAKEGGSLNHPF